MRIDGSTVAMASAHDARREHQVTESLVVTRRAPSAPPSPTVAPPTTGTDRCGDGCADPRTGDADVGSDPRMLVVKLLIEKLTGRPIETLDPEEVRQPLARVALEVARHPAPSEPQPPPSAPSWGVAYDRHEVEHEEEHTAFEATGTVRLADGSSVAFNVQLDMDRVHHEEHHTSVRAGAAAKDPLVLNLADGPARLTGAEVSLDLDGDGVVERFASLAPSSAYLVHDRDGDGTVGSGAELFGPATGDGFAELAAADGDGNSWIDEADAIWSRLALWTVTPGDTDRRLVSLADAGVGAIAVARVATPFSLKEGDRQLGAVRATGVYLRESGGAGTVQQLDLVV